MLVCSECGESYPSGTACPRDGGALAEGSQDPLLGQWVGSYRVASRIGAGGMGAVYLAVQPAIGSRVAIKVITGNWSAQSPLVERFFVEARAVNLIRHEGIVNVLDLAWLPDGRPYIVMEHLAGSPLSRTLREQGQLPLGTLLRFGREICEAIGAAHDSGVVHRDLKPDNLFITRQGRVKVLDFGIAKLGAQHDGLVAGATATGTILGTPAYMAPEQVRGGTIDPRTDVYSLGVVLYEACTGRVPFVGTTLFEVLQQHLEAEPPPPERLRPGLPEPLKSVLLRALEKAPSRRFPTAHALGAALAEVEQRLSGAALASVAPAVGTSGAGNTGNTGGTGSTGSAWGATGNSNAEGATGKNKDWGATASTPGRTWAVLVFVVLGALAVLGLAVLVVGFGVWALSHATFAALPPGGSTSAGGSRSSPSAATPPAANPPGGDPAAPTLRWLSGSIQLLRSADGATPQLVGEAGWPSGRELTLLDGRSGRVLWHRRLFDANNAVYADGRDRLLVGTGAKLLLGCDARTGEQRWSTQLATPISDVTFGSGCASLQLSNVRDFVGIDTATGEARSCGDAPNPVYPSLRDRPRDAKFELAGVTLRSSILRDARPVAPEPPRLVVNGARGGRELFRTPVPVGPVGDHSLVAPTDAGVFVYGRDAQGNATWALVEVPSGRLVYHRVSDLPVTAHRRGLDIAGAGRLVFVLRDWSLEAFDAPTGNRVWTVRQAR